VVERIVSPTSSSFATRAVWRSPAKVNLCLRVVGRRDDGYHLLDSIFVAIDLCDRITLEVADARPGGPSEIEVRCGHPGVPETTDNLAARAATALLADCGWGAHVRCTIDKTIPPGTGLGGGSGNAATVLLALNTLLGLRIPGARLRELGIRIGADVPFFLDGRPARVQGIGERMEPIPGWPALRLVVAIPRLGVETRWAFRAFAARGRIAPGDEAARLADGAAPTSDLLVNDLEQVVLPAFPTIAELKRRLLAAGATAAVMSGSGSAVVGIAASASAAERIAEEIRRRSPGTRAHALGVLGADAVGPFAAGG